jgi:hypothetical protein
MAAGSQLENGICALLVNLAIRIKDLIIIRNLFSHKWE